MMLIRCPWCGERSQVEFTYGGDGTLVRPAETGPGTEQAWHDFVYLRANPRGPHRELWQHSSGCRQWIAVTRDTLTHRILETAPAARPAKPGTAERKG